jgi:hypothetical protein
MTIDERLEALSQSVELLAQLHQKLDKDQLKTHKEIRLARIARAILVDQESRLLRPEAEEEDEDDGHEK